MNLLASSFISLDYVTKKVKICCTEILRLKTEKSMYSQFFLRKVSDIAPICCHIISQALSSKVKYTIQLWAILRNLLNKYWLYVQEFEAQRSVASNLTVYFCNLQKSRSKGPSIDDVGIFQEGRGVSNFDVVARYQKVGVRQIWFEIPA